MSVRQSITIRAAKADIAEWTKQSIRDGISFSEWVRRKLNGFVSKPSEAQERAERRRPAGKFRIFRTGGFDPNRRQRPRSKSTITKIEDVAHTISRKNGILSVREMVAQRTGHEVGCACFTCVQAERFIKAQRKETK